MTIASAICSIVTDRAFPPSKRRSDGRAPLAIRDSVMLGAVSELTATGLEADVRGCRMFAEGISLLAGRRERGRCPVWW